MPGSTEEKTEKATPKRRQEARKKGNVAKSPEVSSALVLLTGTLVLAFTSHHFFGNIKGMTEHILSNVLEYQITRESLRLFGLQIILLIAKILAPLFLSVLVIGTTANVMQIGFLITGESIKPDIKKINPINGFKQIFSIKSLAELVKSILKIVIIGAVIFFTIKSEAKHFLPLMDQNLSQVFMFLGNTILKVAIRVSIALIILAILDFAFQKWKHEKDLRMTKKEVRDEHKEREGDPTVKSRIRDVQREMSRKRMMSEVPEADVVITNPVHYAVAIKYNSGEMEAPKVIAKGARKIAEKIKMIAVEHNIPVIEDPFTARTLYNMCEIGMEIPMELYKSVAEILAQVYRMKQQGV